MLEFAIAYTIVFFCFYLYEKYTIFKILFPLIIIAICAYLLGMVYWIFIDPRAAIAILIAHILVCSVLSAIFLIFGGIISAIAAFFFVVIKVLSKSIKTLFNNIKNIKNETYM